MTDTFLGKRVVIENIPNTPMTWTLTPLPDMQALMNAEIAHATFKDGPHPFPLSITVPQDIEDRDTIIKDLTAADSVNWFGVPCKLALESVEGDMVNLMASPIDTGT